MRDGEMAALDEIPFGRYYGSADATPLFVMLAAAYFDRTSDAALIEKLWPHILAALNWMDELRRRRRRRLHRVRAAQRDGTGPAGLEGLVGLGVSQRRHAGGAADRALRDPGLCLRGVERRGAAGGSARRPGAGANSGRRARRCVQERFERAFWCEELGTYALALDAKEAAVPRAHSNPGHCLFTGIVARRARARSPTR